MFQALIVVFREGFEAFLTVAIILTYLRKTGREALRSGVYWGIAVSIAASFGLGWLLQGVNKPLWEGVLGVLAAVLVASFVVHMWKVGPTMKRDMEVKLAQYSSNTSRSVAYLGVFGFTVLMVTREGMETALMLIQLRSSAQFLTGALLGIGAAAAMSWAWAHYGHRINVRRFFQVTGMFLLMFTVQILFYAFHEFSEAGVLPNSEAIHNATELYSPDGRYGMWLSVLMVAICAMWLVGMSFVDRAHRNRQALAGTR
jgi:high-affinity iron transporter